MIDTGDTPLCIASCFNSHTCRTDQDDTLADFSNWGAVDIAAPGVCIYSTFPIERGNYGTISGTSMASPHVAGAAALLASNGDDPGTIRSRLLNSGNFDWTDDSPESPVVTEPLLDISDIAFAPTLVASGGDGGGGNSAPTASFTHDPCVVDEICSFDGSGSFDYGTIVIYEWDFNESGTTDDTGMLVSYTFTSSGPHMVKLTVTDDGALTGFDTQEVSVSSGGAGNPDACDGLADGVYLTPASTNQGRIWTAIVDAVNCVGGDLANFDAPATVSWSPEVGPTVDNCDTSTNACQATQSEIRKNIGSVELTLNGAATNVFKP